MLSRLDVPGVPGEEDAAALGAAVRLADKRPGFPLTTTGLEVAVATGGQRLLVRRALGIAAAPGPRGVPPALWAMLSLEPSVSEHPTSTPWDEPGRGARVGRERRRRPPPPRWATHSEGRHQVRGKMLYSRG